MSKRGGFDRSDFTGSEGPGMAKLRAAKLGAEMVRKGSGPKSGLAQLQALMRAGDWRGAILMAGAWSDGPPEAKAGREAIMRPAFQRQLKRDPEAICEVAKAAIIQRYSK